MFKTISSIYFAALICVTCGKLANEESKETLGPCNPIFCPNTKMSSLNVLNFCNQTNGFYKNRCCMQKDIQFNSDVITALDYSDCKIEKLTKDLQSFEANLVKNVTVLDITGNLIIECDETAFARYVYLQKLYRPKGCDCPGGVYSWSKITSDSCLDRRPICNTDFVNSNCTSNSACFENGPGNILCNCKSGFHGYKCLEQGYYPKLAFTLMICLPTLFLCAFLWHTQRRYVIKKDL